MALFKKNKTITPININNDKPYKEYSNALVENLTFFADTVWIIDVNNESVTILHDKIHPGTMGSVYSLSQVAQQIRNNHHDDEAEILNRLNINTLKTLKTTSSYEELPFYVDGIKHSFRCVYTPELDELGNVVRVYVTFRDFQDLFDQQQAITKIIDTMYFCAYSIDYDICEMSEIYAPDELRKLVGKNGNAVEALDKVRKNLISLEYQDDARAFFDWFLIKTKLKKQKSISFDFYSGRRGWCRASFIEISRNDLGEIRKLLLVCSDIDDEYEAKAELDSINRMITALSHDYLNVFIINKRYKTIHMTKVGTDIVEILQLDQDQNHSYNAFVKLYARKRVHPDDAKDFVRNQILKNIEAAVSLDGEYSYRYRALVNGSYHHFQLRYVASAGTDEIIVGVRNIDNIVEEQEQYRAQIELALSQVARANDAKSTLLSSISHDIRTPLNDITGLTAITRKKIDNKKKVLDNLDKIEKACNEMLNPINEVLNLIDSETKAKKNKNKISNKPSTNEISPDIPVAQVISNGPKPERNITGISILIVEDNELNREIAAELLAEQGAIVDVAEDGLVALNKIQNSNPEDYDLVLMDIQMPILDGYEATKAIRAIDNPNISSIPIVAMTANAFETDKDMALECGMNGFVTKPIDMNDLLDTIKDVIR